MRFLHYACVLLLGAWSMGGALYAQNRPVSLAAGGGLLFADDGSTMLHSRGITGFVRLSWRRFPLILDASVQNVPGNRGIVFGPCPPSPAACGSDFTGPTTALTLAPAIQATQRVPVAAWLFRLGPSVSWLADRAEGSHPLAAGVRAGVSVRNGQQSGLLISADYFRLFRNEPPAWFFPITIGWQF
jgi:hypothetical protein